MTQLRGMLEVKKNITAQIKSLREPVAKVDTFSLGNSHSEQALLRGVKSVADLDAKIKALEEKQSNQTLKITEEKKIIQDLAFLKHKGRALVSESDNQRKNQVAEKESRQKMREELEAARKQQDVSIDALQVVVNEKRAVVDAIRAKQNAELDLISKDMKVVDRDQQRKVITDCKAEINRLYEEYSKARDEWYANERLARDQQKLAQKVKAAKIKAEKDARRAEREAELAKLPPPDPYEVEKGMCDNLTAYLTALLPMSDQAAASSETAAKTDAQSIPVLNENKPRVVEKDAGAKQIGKGAGADQEDDKYAALRKGKKKGKGKSAAKEVASDSKSSTDTKLAAHSMERFLAFQKLNIKPPTLQSEIAPTLESIRVKREYFESAPEKAKEPKARTSQKSSSGTEKSAKATGSSEFNVDEAFSHALGENVSSTVAASADPSRPSFSDVIRGRGSSLPTSELADLAIFDVVDAGAEDIPSTMNGDITYQ